MPKRQIKMMKICKWKTKQMLFVHRIEQYGIFFFVRGFSKNWKSSIDTRTSNAKIASKKLQKEKMNKYIIKHSIGWVCIKINSHVQSTWKWRNKKLKIKKRHFSLFGTDIPVACIWIFYNFNFDAFFSYSRSSQSEHNEE